jgi:DNA-binding beta-propeller fold protein YncE/predicted Ser/Thr protein kinase
MDVHPPVDIGTDFLGYRVEELIGRGGMGVVYRAYDLRLKRSVAVKFVAPSLALDERFRERFARETELVMSLEHPNVVPIYDAGDVEGRLYLAMRLVEGPDLGSLLRAEGALEPVRTVAICAQIASALDAAHARGLVHRDVKPSNVLLDGSEHVYLADFGLTRSLGNPIAESGEERSIGTPAYLAPEQLEGLAVDGRADIYSLGCLLYECLTGERVFPRDSRLAEAWAHLEEEPPRASRKRRGLPEPVDRVISRALAKEPAERYPTCGALIAAAESELGLRRPARFGGRVAVAVVAIAVAIAAALAVVIAVRRSPAAPPLTHANTLVRIDPRTNNVQRVIDVGREPRAVAAWLGTVWVYSSEGGVVKEVDAQTNHVLQTTPIPARPVPLTTTIGPVLAADRSGAWIVGVDGRGRAWLTLVPPDGRRRAYPLGGRPMAVATGLHAVWVLERGTRRDRLLRLDPATGRLRVQARMRLSSGVDTLTFGFGDLWLVGSRTAKLYRVDPRSGSVRHRDLGQTAGRPVAMLGDVWVNVSDDGGFSMVVDPRTLLEVTDYTGAIGPLGTIGADGVGAYSSVWSYDVGSGEVDRWHPPNLVAHTSVTHAPLYGGSCMTSMAAGGGAIWVTLAPAAHALNGNSICELF